MQEIVKNGQVTLEKRRMEADEMIHNNYANQHPEYAYDFNMR